MHIFNFAGDTTHGFSIKLLKISLHCHPAVGISMVVTIGRKCPIKFSPFCQRKRLVLNRMLMVSLHSPAGAYREVVIPLESVSMISMSERQADAFQPLCCLELTSARLPAPLSWNMLFYLPRYYIFSVASLLLSLLPCEILRACPLHKFVMKHFIKQRE